MPILLFLDGPLLPTKISLKGNTEPEHVPLEKHKSSSKASHFEDSLLVFKGEFRLRLSVIRIYLQLVENPRIWPHETAPHSYIS